MSAPAPEIKNQLAANQSDNSSSSAPSAKIRQSALFAFIEREEKTLKRKYRLEKSTHGNRAAFYISLKDELASLCDLYSHMGYERKGRHLSVDKLYAQDTTQKGVRGYSYAHYTEEWGTTGSAERLIIVHAYFNRLGQLINFQVKAKDSSENAKLCKISSELKIQITKNAQEAKEVLLSLLELMAEKYQIALQKANELENSLSKLSKLCTDQDFIDNYITIAKDFIHQLTVVNLYDDLQYDYRGELIAHYLEVLEHQKNVKNTARQPDVNTDAEEPSHALGEALSETPSLSKANKPHVENPIIALRQQEAALDKLLSSGANNLTAQIQAFIMRQKLKINSSAAFLEDGLKKKTRKSILGILDKIEQQESFTYEELLVKAYQTGERGAFQELFLSRKGYPLSLAFLENMIRWMATEEDEALRSRHIEICHFMLEFCESYRQFICFSSHRIGGPRFPVDGAPHKASLLGITLQYENLAFFAMLLEHGYNPNEYSIVYNGHGISAIKACIITRGEAPVYISKLLQYGAMLDQPSAFVVEGGNFHARKQHLLTQYGVAIQDNVRSRFLLGNGKAKNAMQKEMELHLRQQKAEAQTNQTPQQRPLALEKAIAVRCDLELANILGQSKLIEVLANHASTANPGFVTPNTVNHNSQPSAAAAATSLEPQTQNSASFIERPNAANTLLAQYSLHRTEEQKMALADTKNLNAVNAEVLRDEQGKRTKSTME